eukprot:GFYU01001255.1.p1 GENE.GFYU01001255.1~~GFYU01001255.1.p1  ORF type:complete len:443 (+),score=139.93 GFYU01001255.1:204-1532(+)
MTLTSPSASRLLPHVSSAVKRWTHLVIEKAKGSYVYAEGGNKYLDFTCGIGVTSTGHCHPKVVERVQQQAATLVHAQQNIALHKPMLELVEKLRDDVMPPALDSYFFYNSGSEAVESAVKAARIATGRQNVVVFQGGFHGRTAGTMSLTTSSTMYRAGAGPLVYGSFVSPFADCYRCRRGTCNQCCDGPLESLYQLMEQQTTPNETAAMIIEPIQGEGGYNVAPASFLRGIREFCDQHNILLIADEVQSGVGRTGKYWAVEHSDVTPDILVFAKGIASGYPFSGIATTKDIMDKQLPGSMGGTYGGNAIGCAASVATLDVIREENVMDNVNARGAQMTEALRTMQGNRPDVIGDVRGLGLMIGLEFAGPLVSKGFAADVVHESIRRGLLLMTAGTRETIRFIPPLTVTPEEMREGLEIFEEAVDTVVKKRQFAYAEPAVANQ